MNQNDLNRAVAKATGETITTIKQRSFFQTDPDENNWDDQNHS